MAFNRCEARRWGLCVGAGTFDAEHPGQFFCTSECRQRAHRRYQGQSPLETRKARTRADVGLPPTPPKQKPTLSMQAAVNALAAASDASVASTTARLHA